MHALLLALPLMLSAAAPPRKPAAPSRTHASAPAPKPAAAPAPAPAPAPARTPVLVELFTSEGCSSCPAADDALARLLRSQPVEGVELIALGFHVDYWDELGWADPYGLPLSAEHQKRYAGANGDNTLYTPQMVVDGLSPFAGNEDKARAAATERARQPKVPLRLAAPVEGDAVVVRVGLDAAPPPDTELFVALTEDGLSSQVTRGENAGRTLAHAAVVRAWEPAPAPKAGTGGFASEVRLKLAPGWKREHLRAVAVLQETRGPVRGLASVVPGTAK